LVDFGILFRIIGTYFDLSAYSYRERLKTLATTNDTAMPSVIGKKLLIDCVVSSMIIQIEYVHLQYEAVIAAAPITT